MSSNGQTWLICGGRDFADRGLFERAMAQLFADRGRPAKIVHGGARGADTMGGELGEKLGLPTVAVMADWSIGRKAGPIRNQRMLDEHAPDLVVAFPGGRGTADMVRRARKSGVEVAKIGRRDSDRG
jgi:SLOG family YspA-like protein